MLLYLQIIVLIEGVPFINFDENDDDHYDKHLADSWLNELMQWINCNICLLFLIKIMETEAAPPVNFKHKEKDEQVA